MPCNKSIKFVPAFGLHRTPLSGRRLFQRYALKSLAIFRSKNEVNFRHIYSHCSYRLHGRSL